MAVLSIPIESSPASTPHRFLFTYVCVIRLIDRYIAKQIISATVFGVVVLSGILVMGNLFKELRPLLVEDKASIVQVGQFILSFIFNLNL